MQDHGGLEVEPGRVEMVSTTAVIAAGCTAVVDDFYFGLPRPSSCLTAQFQPSYSEEAILGRSHMSVVSPLIGIDRPKSGKL